MATRLMAVTLMAATSLLALGQSAQQDHFALTVQQVAQTLSEKGMLAANQQVSLLANVVATEPHPVLDILTVEPLGDRWSTKHSEANSLIKLACHVPGTCVPFYAITSRPEVKAAPANNAPGASPGPPSALLKSNAAITMRAGTHATLVMDDDRSRIQIAVVSLESGSAGHRIRVSSPDHKQIYVAEVVSSSLLKGSF